jgi:hypothetical protein
MSVLVNKSTCVICRGFTGSRGLLPAAVICGLLATTGPTAAEAVTDIETLRTAFISCYVGARNPDTVAIALGEGWRREDDAEQGLTYFYNTADDTMFIYASDEGQFCQLESLVLPSADMRKLVVETMTDGGLEPSDAGLDDLGCPAHTTPPGAFVAVNSGGQDPVCDAPSSSAVRVTFPAE